MRADALAQPKYGNDIDEIDDLVAELWGHITDVYMAREDIFGRKYIIYRQGSSVARLRRQMDRSAPQWPQGRRMALGRVAVPGAAGRPEGAPRPSSTR